MTLLDERGAIIGRLKRAALGDFMLVGREPTLDDFPDTDGDGRHRFTVMAIGPGDGITIPTSADL